MTTSDSPAEHVKRQADHVAMVLKKFASGDPVPSAFDPLGRIAGSLKTGKVKFGIIMDDKVITVEMQWDMIRAATEQAISAWIVEYMQGKKTTTH